jgi:hypothetical protein
MDDQPCSEGDISDVWRSGRCRVCDPGYVTILVTGILVIGVEGADVQVQVRGRLQHASWQQRKHERALVQC